jgi:hypothetical protein
MRWDADDFAPPDGSSLCKAREPATLDNAPNALGAKVVTSAPPLIASVLIYNSEGPSG